MLYVMVDRYDTEYFLMLNHLQYFTSDPIGEQISLWFTNARLDVNIDAGKINKEMTSLIDAIREMSDAEKS